ncbi:MAG: hypothetical protein JWL68_5444 [Actinomycetia bacterium]|nr:hypothetical protein [Actinomycetes bacterium]
MPLPQVSDRLKEVPAQALRTIFATIGQLLLVADRLRARATGQPPGSGDATAAQSSEQGQDAAPQAPAPQAPAPPATHAAPTAAEAQDAETARWRSLDKTGNVRLLDGEEEQDEDLAVPGPVSQATAEPAPAAAEYTPTEIVPAVSVPAEPASPEPPLAGTSATSPADLAPGAPAPAGLTADVPVPAGLTADVPASADLIADPPHPADVPVPADLTPDAPAPGGAGLTPAEPAPAPAGETLPVPNYDQLTVASLRARLRVLDTTQVEVLLDYEKAHEGRPAMITMFERRITKLSEGS